MTYSERDLGGEGATMVDDGRTVVSIPAVQLHTPEKIVENTENMPVSLHGVQLDPNAFL